MLILVTGGAASGKSEHAERLLCEKAQSRLYLATMHRSASLQRRGLHGIGRFVREKGSLRWREHLI